MRTDATRAQVVDAIRTAAARTGVDFGFLLAQAGVESGLDPTARARTSSASGLYQFIDSTWLATLARHGAKHGLDALSGSRAGALALRDDPLAAALMAAEHAADNGRALAGALGRAATGPELYLAHFLGVGGATRFLDALANTPDHPAALLLPAAARANPSIFTAPGGSPRSIAAVFDLLSDRLAAAGKKLPASGNALPAATVAAGPAPGFARLAYLMLATLDG